MREPALEVENGFGNRITELRFRDYRILKGEAAAPEGLPGVFAGSSPCDTLQITLEDSALRLEVVLNYIVFDDSDILVRNAVIRNRSQVPVRLTEASSFSGRSVLPFIKAPPWRSQTTPAEARAGTIPL